MHERTPKLATIKDKGVDTFEQNKRFLLASFRNFKKVFFVDSLNPLSPFPMLRYAPWTLSHGYNVERWRWGRNVNIGDWKNYSAFNETSLFGECLNCLFLWLKITKLKQYVTLPTCRRERWSIFLRLMRFRKQVLISDRCFYKWNSVNVLYACALNPVSLIRVVCTFTELRRRVSKCQAITLWITALGLWTMTKTTTRLTCMKMLLLILDCRTTSSKRARRQ